MKNILTIIFGFVMLQLTAQMQIQTTVSVNPNGLPPDYSAAVDISSTTQGVLIPRMTFAQRNVIINPADGLMVFCFNCGVDGSSSLCIFTNGKWQNIELAQQFVCGDSLRILHQLTNGVAPINKSTKYATVTNIPGEPTKCWITSNLGSTRQALNKNDASEDASGWYWQFNRKQGYKHDGTLRTPNTTWITSINENYNWTSANDPCSIELRNGWRLPTETEWINVDATGGWTTLTNAWNSQLKIHGAGRLYTTDGSLAYRGANGYYWGSTQTSTTNSKAITLTPTTSVMTNYVKYYGFSVRCIL